MKDREPFEGIEYMQGKVLPQASPPPVRPAVSWSPVVASSNRPLHAPHLLLPLRADAPAILPHHVLQAQFSKKL